MLVVLVVTYVAAVVFVAAVVARVVKYATTPIHLRWELYPVPHEKGRAAWGGSIFEELEWWKKPRQLDRIGELRQMLAEIALLKGVWHHNRKLWFFSFPFHLGLYLLIGWLLLLLVAGILINTGTALRGTVGDVFSWLVYLSGYGGLGLLIQGALGLLLRRVFDGGIRRYSSPAEYINLLFILAVAVVALIAQATTDPGFGRLAGYLASVIGFSRPRPLPTLLAMEVVAGALLVAYIPLTRMAHFVAKYFLYHDVRWADEPNPRGGRIEGQLKQVFAYRLNWSARHIQQGKSWAEVGTNLQGVEEVKK